MLDIIDRLASSADEQTKEDMKHHYLRAALYEYAFWDYGYEGEEKSYKYSHSLEGWL